MSKKSYIFLNARECLTISEKKQYQGDELLDSDGPSAMEAKLFCTTFGKIVWMFFQPIFYAIRPCFIQPLPTSKMEIVNIITQLSFDFIVLYFLGKYVSSLSPIILVESIAN